MFDQENDAGRDEIQMEYDGYNSSMLLDVN